MKYDSISDLKTAFTKGSITTLPDEISVSDVEYKLSSANTYPFDDIINGSKKPMVIFALKPTPENKVVFDKKREGTKKNDDSSAPQDRIVFVWTGVRMNVRPVEVKSVPHQRMKQVMVREAEVDDDRIITNKVSIILSGFNSNNPIEAKVDTGAAVCSLDANDVTVDRNAGIVKFSFGDRRVTMPLVDTQAITTADGGIENRPVVQFDVLVPNADPQKKNRTIPKVQFNLNDRSGMPDKVLLGQNFIKTGNFVIMDKNDEDKVIESDEIDWDALQSMFEDVEIVEESVSADSIKRLLQVLTESDAKISDIVMYLKTQIVESLE